MFFWKANQTSKNYPITYDSRASRQLVCDAWDGKKAASHGEVCTNSNSVLKYMTPLHLLVRLTIHLFYKILANLKYIG
jgi:hypothetical protein